MTWHARLGGAKPHAQVLVSIVPISARFNWHVVRFYRYNEMYCVALVFRRGKKLFSLLPVSHLKQN